MPLTPGLSDIKLGTFLFCKLLLASSYLTNLGLAGIHQLQNANLAVHLSRSFLHSQTATHDTTPLPISYIEGLKNAKWPGRCQTVADPNHNSTTWFLDGAHTIESLECCIQWFVSPDVGLNSFVFLVWIT